MSALKGAVAGSLAFTEVIWPGRNTSGVVPYGRNILVKMDEVHGTTKGNVILIEDRVEQETAKTVTGCIFAIGPTAFRRFDDGTKWEGTRPEIGDRIYILPYAGEVTLGRDGGFYRLMDANCVIGGIDKDWVDEEEADVAG